LNRLVSAVALLGAFQFVFAVASIKKECTQEHPCSGILELLPNADVINSDGLILLLLGTLGAIVWFGWRRRT
jgi:hypothetical protein